MRGYNRLRSASPGDDDEDEDFHLPHLDALREDDDYDFSEKYKIPARAAITLNASHACIAYASPQVNSRDSSAI